MVGRRRNLGLRDRNEWEVVDNRWSMKRRRRMKGREEDSEEEEEEKAQLKGRSKW